MNGQNNKRKVLILAGASDVLIGTAIALIGLGFFHVDISSFGIPPWAAIVIGGVIFASGAWMLIHNYSRVDE